MSTRADPGDAGWLNDPGDEEPIDDDDAMEMMAMMGITPDRIPDPVERAKFAKFLETYKPES